VAAAEARLITFPPSVDSETARWILAHHGVAYREVRQSAVGAGLRTVWHRAAIPILFRGGAKLSPSRPILDHLDARAAPERRLLPQEPGLAAEAETLWREYNGEMGVWIARFVYFYVLQDRALALRLMGDGVPRWQAALDALAFPLVRFAMRRGLGGLDRRLAEDARDRCRRAFDGVAERLRDGRRYLLGERFTLADAAFCACAAPLMLAEVYGGSLPRLEEMPGEMQEEVRRFRQHAAGAYALRVYGEHYRPSPAI
jgi:glutathione S-transferase